MERQNLTKTRLISEIKCLIKFVKKKDFPMKDLKLDKQEIKKPDAFLKLASELTAFVSKHRGAVIGVLLLGALSSAGIGIYVYYQDTVEASAQEALFQARKKLRPELSIPLGQQAPATTAKKLNDDSINELNQVMTKFPKSRAAVVAAIELSQAYLDENKGTDAVTAIKKVNPSVSSSDILYGIYKYQLGKALSASGQCDEAVSHLNAIANSNGPASVFKSGALLQTGLCYESMKQTEKAIEIYERVSKEFSDGASADSARKYLRLLKHNSKS